MIYDKKKIVEYDDVTLAYIFNNAVQNGANSSSDAVKVLKDANVVVKEITIGVSDGKALCASCLWLNSGNTRAI